MILLDIVNDRWILPRSDLKMVSELINANPIVYEKERQARIAPSTAEHSAETIDQLEIFDILLNECILPVMFDLKLIFLWLGTIYEAKTHPLQNLWVLFSQIQSFRFQMEQY